MSMLGVFQLRLIWEGPPQDDDEDSGYVPTPIRKLESPDAWHTSLNITCKLLLSLRVPP